ncbi:MAG: elongation factor G [Clostridia bacterium]|nr:elongation factor G [Clostridia bacterium]
MKSTDIRNVVFLGHSGVGKTTVGESMLYISKATDRLGQIADGNTVLDYDPEEIKRHVSVQAAVAPCNWQGKKINIIDTPGYFDFVAEQLEGVAAADSAIIVVAGDSVSVGAEKAWDIVTKAKMPRMFFVNRLNEENANFEKLYASMRETFGTSCVTLQLPVFENRAMVGMVDTVKMVGYKIGKDGTFVEDAIPASVKDEAESIHNDLKEAVAESDEELMMKYFEGEEFTDEEMVTGLKKAIVAGTCAPVLVGAANENTGVKKLLDFIVEYMPDPTEVPPVVGTDKDGNPVEIKVDAAGSPLAFVFKTIVDPFVGRLSIFKVYSGTIKADNQIYNVNEEADERFTQVFTLRGKKQQQATEIIAGDIGAVSKLTVTQTNDTLGTKANQIELPAIQFPEAQIVQAITPKTRGDEDKLNSSLSRLAEEDPTFHFGQSPDTGESTVSGMGEMHIDIIMSKLKTRYGVGVDISDPKIAYRETIRSKVTAEGLHKKQSGGAGQYGKVVIEFEPGEKDELEFAENVFGGAVPKQFFPSVEKGLQESVKKGVLAGYPVVRLKATLVDGKYHPVDSKEVAFVSAAKLAFQDGVKRAKPVLLEPVVTVNVYVPDRYMGDVIGDMNKRRGRILGMNPIGGGIQEIVAEAPMAEMTRYAIDLRAITQARGSFHTEFARYEDVPEMIAQKIIEEAKKNAAENED